MKNIRQTYNDLNRHLNEQLGFLKRSAASYDTGYQDEAKRLAVSIRVLVHDTERSISLLTQLNMKDILFLDTSIPDKPGNILPYCGLIQMAFGPSGALYLPFLDDPNPDGPARKSTFNDWWDLPVFRTGENRILSRKDLILIISNQDGGAHVDPSLNETYAELTRGPGMMWIYEGEKESYKVRPPELAAVRQIAHEVIKTLDPAYKAHPVVPHGYNLMAGASIKIGSGDSENPTISSMEKKIGRNERCPCGSGKKYKKCHGK